MKEKISRFALISVGILSSGILLFAFLEYVLPVVLPFLIAWLVASMTASPAKKLSEKIKAPERVIRLVMSVVIILVVFTAVSALVWRGATAIWRFLSDIDSDSRIYNFLESLLSPDAPLLGNYLPEGLAERVSEALGGVISSGLSMIAEGITSLATAIPQFFLFILVTLISLIYFAIDYDKIGKLFISILPQKVSATLQKIKTTIVFVIKKYILSYSLILLITYTTMLVGLSLLRVRHAAVLSLFIALLDILPVIGVGTVLLPWGIFELATSGGFLGVGLILLFAVNTVIRQFSEPRIVGKSLDMHPVITLIMIYVGYALFGFVGVIALPIVGVSIGAMLKGDNSPEVN